MIESYKHYYIKRQETGRYRELPPEFNPSLLDFSTNDYLGLSKDPTLLAGAIEAGKHYGVGSTGSRLLSGNKTLFEQFETQIAVDKKTEAALIFNSGFQANITVLSSLLNQSVLGAKPFVFFDKANHASLYQAVFLSQAELIRYNHHNLNQLESLLEKYKNHSNPKFIVTETVFGMHGDIINITALLTLAKKYNAFVYLDEAHATGIIGDEGYGLSSIPEINQQLKPIPHMIMGTFSKAIGCSGGYIACSHELKKYVLNNSAGFIYSTAPSPLVIGAAYTAWQKIKNPEFIIARKKLFTLAQHFRQQLHSLGFNTGNSSSHIIPLILNTEKKVADLNEKLLHNNILVSSIRPPTVAPNQSCLRIALTIHHTEDDIYYFNTILASLL